MTKTKSPKAGERTHTPGPWTKEGGGSLSVFAGRGEYDRSICEVSTSGMPFHPDGSPTVYDQDESEANARLIAAAPELLTAIKLIGEAVKHRYATTGKIEIEGLVETALALAGGEQGFTEAERRNAEDDRIWGQGGRE